MDDRRRGGRLVGMKRLVVLAALLLAALAAGCGSSRSTGAERTPVVVDTDLSSDDVLALLYLAQSPKVELKAVTVAGTGLVHCPAGARNALELLALAGQGGVPVACGSDTPLGGLNAVPAEWRTAADGLFGLELPPAQAKPRGDAVSLLRQTAPGATVLELAPMTNLAGAFRSDRKLAARIDRVVAMGGALDVPGNAPGALAAETNAWLDPTALREVLRSGVPVTLVPLDATNQVPVTTYVSRALQRYHYATPAATAAWDLVSATHMDTGGTYFWDPLAAALVVDPAVASTASRHVDVSADGRTVRSGAGADITAATRVLRTRFERDLVGGLLGGAAFTIPPRRPTATVTWDGKTCAYHGAASWHEGRVVLDTVNRSETTFQYVVVQVTPPHTVADLKAYVGGLTALPQNPPRWIAGQAFGSTPPHSDMTWVAYASSGTTGSVVVACTSTAPPYAAFAATVPVYSRQG
jgi:inosine-uridine nucleoside N-ribohydrolase